MEASEDLPASSLLQKAHAQALADPDRDAEATWALIRSLHARPEQAVFDAAAAWCRSDDPREREFGADVLAQLGRGAVSEPTGLPFADESEPILLTLLNDEDAEVVSSATFALGHSSPAALYAEQLRPLATHPAERVRFAVALALGGEFQNHSEAATELLTGLMEDADEHVRDWATFGLASGTADTPTVRDALLRRLEDEDEETRGEAFVGLAQRHERRVLPHLLAALYLPTVPSLVLDAAREWAGPELLPALLALRDRSSESERVALEEAIAACHQA